MDFSGDLATIQRQLARSADMAARRVRVLETLGAAPGERIAELGCGGGFTLREIAVAVGETGLSFGLDLSEDQVRVARTHCSDLKQADVQRPLTIINRHVHPSTFAHGAGRLMAAFARAQGELDRESTDAWLAADAKGLHPLSVVQILTTATLAEPARMPGASA